MNRNCFFREEKERKVSIIEKIMFMLKYIRL